MKWSNDTERNNTLTSLRKNSLMPPQHYLQGNKQGRNVSLYVLLALMKVCAASKIN